MATRKASAPDRSEKKKKTRKSTPKPAFPQAGFTIGEYVIRDMLGHGSMSTVFLAADGTGHEVALKVFQERDDVSPTLFERFRREIEASKQLREHPNIITTYGSGQDHAFHYIAMQRIRDGRNLDSVIQNERIPINQCVTYAIKIARALDFAHGRGIIHRDVKPANIMINKFDEPLLADLGVASLNEWPKFTVAGALTGTPLYMSPEQARCENLTPAADIYSLGVVLYELLTGELPYRAPRHSSVPDTLRAVQHDPPRRPRIFRRDISPELEAVVLKALSKSPENRYASAEAFARDLEHARADEMVDAQHYSIFTSILHRLRRRRLSLAIMGALVLVGLGIFSLVSQMMAQVHYESLIGLARLRNTQLALARVQQGGPLSATAGSQSLRQAQRSMAAGQWQAALEPLEIGAREARSRGDLRTVAAFELEQARCAAMLVRNADGEALYRAILANPDTSPAVAGQAMLEGAMLALVDGRTNVVSELLALRTIEATNPATDALDCLRGDRNPAEVVDRIHTLPTSIQNDTYLAAALIARQGGDTEAFVEYLRSAVTSSRPASEWPGPAARKLLHAQQAAEASP